MPKLPEYLSRWMLVTARKQVIEHKAILEKAIRLYASILPEPTHENCLEQNSHVLLDIRDKFRKYNRSKPAFNEAVWKIGICENEHDPHYRDLYFGWLVEEILEAVLDGRWKPRPTGHPSGYWDEPRLPDGKNYGEYRGRKFAQFIEKTN